ncbi:MAG: hypothetical protein LBM65_05185 [Oscillospiraceae bacterium]|jgi:stage IV sporulation protein FB|nr:hypothetical protein [Oscillospiraceae bacterium]
MQTLLPMMRLDKFAKKTSYLSFFVFGIKLKISFLAVAFFTLVLLLDTAGRFSFCILAVLVHELGHLAAMLLLKTPPKSVAYRLFEIVIEDPDRGSRTYRQNMLITLAGPCVNLITAVVCTVLFAVFKTEVFLIFCIINLGMACFNLLPVISLDGGQALAFTLEKFFSDATVNTIISILTVVILLPTAVFGILLLFNSPYNFSLLFISVYLLLVLVLQKQKVC